MIKNLIFGPCFDGLGYKNIVLENNNFIIKNIFVRIYQINLKILTILLTCFGKGTIMG